MLLAISSHTLGTCLDSPRIDAAWMVFRKVTATPASVKAALSRKLAYSSGSVYRSKVKEI